MAGARGSPSLQNEVMRAMLKWERYEEERGLHDHFNTYFKRVPGHFACLSVGSVLSDRTISGSK